jgi:hypothetical protein
MDSDSFSTLLDTPQLGSDVSTITDCSSSTAKSNWKRRNAKAMARRRCINRSFRAQEQMRNSEAMAMVRQDPVRRAAEQMRNAEAMAIVRQDPVRREQEMDQI